MQPARWRDISTSSEGGEQRQQVFLGRMVLSRIGRAVSVVDQIIRSALRESRIKPIRKLGDPARAGLVELMAAKFRQIMREASASDDQHAFLSQRC